MKIKVSTTPCIVVEVSMKVTTNLSTSHTHTIHKIVFIYGLKLSTFQISNSVLGQMIKVSTIPHSLRHSGISVNVAKVSK